MGKKEIYFWLITLTLFTLFFLGFVFMLGSKVTGLPEQLLSGI